MNKRFIIGMVAIVIWALLIFADFVHLDKHDIPRPPQNWHITSTTYFARIPRHDYLMLRFTLEENTLKIKDLAVELYDLTPQQTLELKIASMIHYSAPQTVDVTPEQSGYIVRLRLRQSDNIDISLILPSSDNTTLILTTTMSSEQLTSCFDSIYGLARQLAQSDKNKSSTRKVFKAGIYLYI